MAVILTPVNPDGTPNGFVATSKNKGGNTVTLVDDMGNPITIGNSSPGGAVNSVNTQDGDVVGTYKTVGTLQKQFDDINTDMTGVQNGVGDLETELGIVQNDITDLNTTTGNTVSQFTNPTPTNFAVTANTDIDISNIITSGTFVETQTGTIPHAFGDVVKHTLKPDVSGWYQLNIIFNLTGGALNDFNASLKLFASSNGTAWTIELPFCFRNQALTQDTTTQGAKNVSFSTQFYFNELGANAVNILTHGVKAIAQISDSGTATDLKIEIGRV